MDQRVRRDDARHPLTTRRHATRRDGAAAYQVKDGGVDAGGGGVRVLALPVQRCVAPQRGNGVGRAIVLEVEGGRGWEWGREVRPGWSRTFNARAGGAAAQRR